MAFSCPCILDILFTKIMNCISYNLERQMHFIGLKGECLRVDANVAFLKVGDDLMSQSSTTFGTHTSNKTWPRTPWALILGGLDRGMYRSFCSCWTDPTLLPSWYSTELGTTKWSFNSRAVLWKLWFAVAAAFLRLPKGSEISSCDPSNPIFSPSSWRILWE